MSKSNLGIIVGGFLGDEGKEVVFSYLSVQDRIDAAIRTQAPQHGGEVWYKGEKSIRAYTPASEYLHDPKKGERHKFRQIPGAIYNPDAELFLAVGAIVDSEVVSNEVKMYTEFDVDSRLKIDENSTAILQRHKEMDAPLKASIGSVGTGYRGAICDRVMGKKDVLVKNVPELKKYSEGVCVWKRVNDYLDDDKSVLILGVQSTHLSTYYGEYPNTNGYDNTAGTLLGQIGIGPNREKNIYLIFKSFVSRVGVGDLEGQISEEEADERGWVERGTVTGRLRRVAPFNYKLAQDSIRLNTPTDLVLTKLDVLFPEAAGVTNYSNLPEDCQLWLEEWKKKMKMQKYEIPPLTLLKTGPRIFDIIDLREEEGTE